jgi:hypothetical protein
MRRCGPPDATLVTGSVPLGTLSQEGLSPVDLMGVTFQLGSFRHSCSRPCGPLGPSAPTRSPAEFHLAWRLALGGELGGFLVQGGDKLGVVRKGLGHAASLDVGVGPDQAGIDDPALRRRLLVVRGGEPGAVNRQFRGRNDLAELEREVHQVTLVKAGLPPGRSRDS